MLSQCTYVVLDEVSALSQCTYVVLDEVSAFTVYICCIG